MAGAGPAAQASQPTALDLLAARREQIANDLGKLEKQVGRQGRGRARTASGRPPRDAGTGCRPAGGAAPSAAAPAPPNHAASTAGPSPPPPHVHCHQIYDAETTYFTAEYTNFGTVLKARGAAGRGAAERGARPRA